MSEPIKIDKNIPLGKKPTKSKVVTIPSKYNIPFKEMEVGDSFALPFSDYHINRKICNLPPVSEKKAIQNLHALIRQKVTEWKIDELRATNPHLGRYFSNSELPVRPHFSCRTRHDEKAIRVWRTL